ncbi:MAG TPA: hypothetical protein VL485_24155 [Ktedonobacteraceae bacterium]|jgi:hypothetical protein|nr:hypothetical protein [Ktedonobacteraceae bacterium]
MTNILLASLGESPIVVPVMYRLLRERKGIEIALSFGWTQGHGGDVHVCSAE